jgi:hypothetical protein
MGRTETMPESSLAARAAAWRDADPDPRTRAELAQLLASRDTAGLSARFDGSLAFGTAGVVDLPSGLAERSPGVVCPVRSRAGLGSARADASDQAERMLATAAALESRVREIKAPTGIRTAAEALSVVRPAPRESAPNITYRSHPERGAR